MNDKIVRIVNLPSRIRAMTSKDSNDDYNIYINGNLALEAQQEAYKHELNHIRNGDYDNIIDVGISEFYLHNVK